MTTYDIRTIVYALLKFNVMKLKFDSDGAFYKVSYTDLDEEIVVGWLTKDDAAALVSDGILNPEDLRKVKETQNG